jgi:hypothetical protein
MPHLGRPICLGIHRKWTDVHYQLAYCSGHQRHLSLAKKRRCHKTADRHEVLRLQDICKWRPPHIEFAAIPAPALVRKTVAIWDECRECRRTSYAIPAGARR